MQVNCSGFLSVIHALIPACERSARKLHAAAEKLTDPSLRPLLNAYALQRDFVVGELSSILMQCGNTPRVGHGSGRFDSFELHGSDGRMLEECEHSELETLQRYERVCALDLPYDIHRLLRQHAEQIRTVYSYVRDCFRPTQPLYA